MWGPGHGYLDSGDNPLTFLHETDEADLHLTGSRSNKHPWRGGWQAVSARSSHERSKVWNVPPWSTLHWETGQDTGWGKECIFSLAFVAANPPFLVAPLLLCAHRTCCAAHSKDRISWTDSVCAALQLGWECWISWIWCCCWSADFPSWTPSRCPGSQSQQGRHDEQLCAGC